MAFDDLTRPLTELEVAVRTSMFLQDQGWATLADLCRHTEAEVTSAMTASPAFKDHPKDAPKSLKELKEILATLGLMLGMDVDAEPTLIGKP